MHSDLVFLGRTATKVSRLGLGTAPLGGLFEPVTEAQASAVIMRSLELGLRMYDTAPLYGCGLAEQRLGSAFAGIDRTAYVIATKVGRLLRSRVQARDSRATHDESFFHGKLPLHPVFDFSYEGIIQSLTESLERLRLETIDIVHIHDPDEHFDQALIGAYRALEDLRNQGVIGAISVGMNQAKMLSEFARHADFDCFLLAGRYTLLDQTALDELLPLCLDKNIAIIIGGVYNSGILADPHRQPRFDYQPAPKRLVDRVRRAEAICATHHTPLKAAALQFPFGHPAVACVLVGCRSIVELDENVDMFDLEIPADLWRELKSEQFLPEHVPVPE